MITEDTPRQSTRAPSVEDIRVKALPIPVYIAAGDVANTCMRVYIHGFRTTNGDEWAAKKKQREREKPTLMLSMGNMTECSVMPA